MPNKVVTVTEPVASDLSELLISFDVSTGEFQRASGTFSVSTDDVGTRHDARLDFSKDDYDNASQAVRDAIDTLRTAALNAYRNQHGF